MNAYISLEDAEKILTNHYQQEYQNFSNFKINYEFEEKWNTYHDCDGSLDSTKYYELEAKVTFQRKINDIITTIEIKKTNEELKKDLKDGLNELYNDEDFNVSYVWFPHFNKKPSELDKKVTIDFTKPKNISLVKEMKESHESN